jgi:hypothetical protein
MEGEFVMTVVAPGITTTSEVKLGGEVFEGPLEGFGGAVQPMGAGPPGAQYHHVYTCSATELRLTATEPIFMPGPAVYQKLP